MNNERRREHELESQQEHVYRRSQREKRKWASIKLYYNIKKIKRNI